MFIYIKIFVVKNGYRGNCNIGRNRYSINYRVGVGEQIHHTNDIELVE